MDSLTENIDGHIYANVPGFYARYFEDTSWSSTAKERAIILQDQAPHLPESAFIWLQQDSHVWLTSSIDSYHILGRWLNLDVLQPSPSTPSGVDIGTDWPHVQIIGNFCNTPSKTYKDSFVQLCREAQKVFEHQPTRRFLHGFHVVGTLFEPWVFDRSGLYSGESWDIESNRHRFMSTLISYSLMSETELGVNTWIKRDGKGKYIHVSELDKSSSNRLHLEEKPIMSLNEIVCNGITVYRAKQSSSRHWGSVAKFKWLPLRTGSTRWPGEERMLRLATERQVWGVIRLSSHHILETLSDLRMGMQFETARKLVDSENTAGILDITQPANSDAESAPAFQDRILSCVVVSPLGRPLREFESICQVLEALGDAVKGHKDLYDKGILHQDVAVNNILIVETRVDETEPKGMLIDLDLALELQYVFPDGRSAAGTPMFMAIEILQSKKQHTYRHDLESFLYVLLCIAIQDRSETLAEGSRLQKWKGNAFDEIAAQKMHDMGFEQFEGILSEFHTNFQGVKGLARELRELLFRPKVEDGSLWVGTDQSTPAMRRLYDDIVNALEAAAASYRRTSEVGYDKRSEL